MEKDTATAVPEDIKKIHDSTAKEDNQTTGLIDRVNLKEHAEQPSSPPDDCNANINQQDKSSEGPPAKDLSEKLSEQPKSEPTHDSIPEIGAGIKKNLKRKKIHNKEKESIIIAKKNKLII